MKSFLNTTEWLEFQKSLGRKVFRFDNGKIWANIIRHDLPFGKNYLYIPHGPEISFDEISGSIKNELAQFVEHVKNLARGQQSIFIKAEPLDDKVPEVLHDFKFKKSSKEVQPHRTVVLDLEKSEEELLSAMHHKTRYNIKISEKYGIITKKSDDVEVFLKMLKKTARRDKFSTHSHEYYKKLLEFFNQDGFKVEVILAVRDERPKSTIHERPVAAAIIMIHGDTGYYLHGASDYEFRQFMSPYGLHWGIIKYLKSKGVKKYDFWGIDAKKWPGVTRFKLGWGGQQVEYPGAFDLSVRGFWYFSYNLLRRIL